uniref:Uncharacterized protein n=1 Tax=Utricularia reniformis TaxID=192314 RepID=A0A1Y0B188_9LAMI|nr:hypothetical protein AEK19_MT0954 [Utricularia reniformis]ART31180.1 hypothetical protein AEK19_MT0954 [Utricularia reniformis]
MIEQRKRESISSGWDRSKHCADELLHLFNCVRIEMSLPSAFSTFEISRRSRIKAIMLLSFVYQL